MRIPGDKKTFLIKSLLGFIVVAIILQLLLRYVFDASGGLDAAAYVCVLGLFPIFCHEILTRGEDFHKEICSSDEALVYFFEPFHFHLPGRREYQVWDDQKCLVCLVPQTYSVLKLPPGEKNFYLDYRHDRNKLNMKLEAGHAYFVKVTLDFVSAKLSVLPEQKALSEISSCDKTASF